MKLNLELALLGLAIISIASPLDSTNDGLNTYDRRYRPFRTQGSAWSSANSTGTTPSATPQAIDNSSTSTTTCAPAHTCHTGDHGPSTSGSAKMSGPSTTLTVTLNPRTATKVNETNYARWTNVVYMKIDKSMQCPSKNGMACYEALQVPVQFHTQYGAGAVAGVYRPVPTSALASYTKAIPTVGPWSTDMLHPVGHQAGVDPRDWSEYGREEEELRRWECDGECGRNDERGGSAARNGTVLVALRRNSTNAGGSAHGLNVQNHHLSPRSPLHASASTEPSLGSLPTPDRPVISHFAGLPMLHFAPHFAPHGGAPTRASGQSQSAGEARWNVGCAGAEAKVLVFIMFVLWI